MTKLFRRLAVVLGAPLTVHPDGSAYVRIRDHWMPL